MPPTGAASVLAGWLSRIHQPRAARIWEKGDHARLGGPRPGHLRITRTIEIPLRDAALRPDAGGHCGDRDPLVPMDDVLAMYDHIPDCGLWLLLHTTHVTTTNTWRARPRHRICASCSGAIVVGRMCHRLQGHCPCPQKPFASPC